MSTNKKQFGVWMDSQNATIVGKQDVDSGDFIVLGHAHNPGPDSNSSERTANNQAQSLTGKYFKEITAFMQNVDEIEVTGTGQIQEEFVRYLSETPQYKNVVATHSTSNKMSDEKLLEFVEEKFK